MCQFNPGSDGSAEVLGSELPLTGEAGVKTVARSLAGFRRRFPRLKTGGTRRRPTRSRVRRRARQSSPALGLSEAMNGPSEAVNGLSEVVELPFAGEAGLRTVAPGFSRRLQSGDFRAHKIESPLERATDSAYHGTELDHASCRPLPAFLTLSLELFPRELAISFVESPSPPAVSCGGRRCRRRMRGAFTGDVRCCDDDLKPVDRHSGDARLTAA